MDRKAWLYFVDIRQGVVALLTGIRDAEFSLFWDNTTSNSTTRHRLAELLDACLGKAASFGVYVVTRHCDCGRRSHSKKSDKFGSVTTNQYGLELGYGDQRFIWTGHQLFQGSVLRRCPCSPALDPVRHNIIVDILVAKGSDETLAETIIGVLEDIQSAVEAAADKHPRSGIREHLLRAMLRANDAIMPMTVDEYVKQQTGGI